MQAAMLSRREVDDLTSGLRLDEQYSLRSRASVDHEDLHEPFAQIFTTWVAEIVSRVGGGSARDSRIIAL